MFILKAQLKRERVTGKAGINYKRTLDTVFFMVNAFFAWRRKYRGYAVKCRSRICMGRICIYRM